MWTLGDSLPRSSAKLAIADYLPEQKLIFMKKTSLFVIGWADALRFKVLPSLETYIMLSGGEHWYEIHLPLCTFKAMYCLRDPLLC